MKIGKIDVKKTVKVQYTMLDNSSKTVEVDRLIVSIGRVPNTECLNASADILKFIDFIAKKPIAWAERKTP